MNNNNTNREIITFINSKINHLKNCINYVENYRTKMIFEKFNITIDHEKTILLNVMLSNSLIHTIRIEKNDSLDNYSIKLQNSIKEKKVIVIKKRKNSNSCCSIM